MQVKSVFGLYGQNAQPLSGVLKAKPVEVLFIEVLEFGSVLFKTLKHKLLWGFLFLILIHIVYATHI